MKISKKTLWVDYVPSALAAILIIVFAIWKQQSFLKTLPTLITLVVLIMSVNANRFAFLVGAGNSLLYAMAYMSEGLYFSAASAALISFPIQAVSFFLWSRHKLGKTQAALKLMNWWQLVLSVVILIPLWAGCYFGLASFFEGSYAAVDSFLFVMGIVVSVQVALRFIEGQYFNIVSCIISLFLWIVICMKSPDNINYVIISCYNIFRTVQAAITWTVVYKKQKTA